MDRALEFGVTDIINSSSLRKSDELATAIRSLPFFDQTAEPPRPRGPTVIVDTTGSPAVMREALKALSPLGKLIQITNPGPGSEIAIPLPEHMRDGASFIGTIQGDANPNESIPMLIQWYRDGQLLLDKMEKEYRVEDWKDAIAALHHGTVIKAVLRW